MLNRLRRHRPSREPEPKAPNPSDLNTTSDQSDNQPNEVNVFGKRPQPPFDAGDIREQFGFDRNDENVTVRFIPLGGTLEDNIGTMLRSALGIAEPGAPGATEKPQHEIEAERHTGPHGGGYAELQPEPDPTVTAAATTKKIAGLRRLEDTREVTLNLVMEVMQEVMRATVKHAPQHSPHEGYAVLLEEVEELLDEIRHGSKHDRDVQNGYSRLRQKVANLWHIVKRDGGGRGPDARTEAIQVAAMAIRYIIDNIDAPPAA